MNQLRILLSAGAAYCMAMLSNWLQPMLVGELIVGLRLGEATAGTVVAVEMAALAITSMVCARALVGIAYSRIMVGGLVALVIGNVISNHAETYSQLTAMRALSGVGAGALLMAASAAIAGFEDSDRAYGQINASSVLCGMAGFALAPIVSAHVSSPITYTIILVVICVLVPLLFLMPKNLAIRPPDAANLQEPGGSSPNIEIALISAGVLLSCSVLASAWAFYVILGELAGFGSEQINAILTFSVLFTLVGSTLASVVGHRFGRLLPSILGILLMTVSIVGLSLSRDPTYYRFLTGLNLLGLYVFVPYFLGYAAGADPSGRGPAIVAGAFMLAAAIGPYLGGIVISRFGIESLALIAVVANSVSFALFYIVNRMQKSTGKALD